MMRLALRRSLLAALSLSLNACEPPDRDIRVVWRDGQLVVDFPWSLWRLVGLQDRIYCVRRVELFDEKGLVWTLTTKADVQCEHVQMPIWLGRPLAKFVSTGRPKLDPGVTYGVEIEGIGNANVAFVLNGSKVRNITERNAMPAPCAGKWQCTLPVRGS